MLRLVSNCVGADAHAPNVPIAERSAVHLERALLATDDAGRLNELKRAVLQDPALADWVVQRAQCRTHGATISIDAAAESWSQCLVAELAATLVASADGEGEAADIEWRLPALVARLHEFDRRLEHEKLESLKELAYGASHEINNPLANIAARAQSLLEDETMPERQRKLLAIYRQAMRAHEMISDLMLFARPPKLRPCPCDLGRLTERVVNEHRNLAAERQIQLTCQIQDPPCTLLVDESQLAVAIGALVTNAIEAVGVDGHVHVGVGEYADGNKRWAEIIVRDSGPGVSADIRRHMFDPFFSGREAGRGLGFGLSKCWRIVTNHGGDVVVSEPEGSGAEISIHLPLTDAPSASAASARH